MSVQVPLQRWDIAFAERISGNTMPQRFGAFISDIYLFDKDAFGISRKEASYMDPQQRLLLQSVGACLHDAQGLLDPSSCSITVGVSYNEYFLNLLHLEKNALMATSGTLSVLSGRVSYTFNLRGPSSSIDTACSSSLVGIHLSITSSMSRGWNFSIASGVNLLISHETSWVLKAASMLSADGRCKTLDGRADGYGRAESCIVHLMKKRDTKGSSSSVYISGTAVGQDGRSSSLTAPNGPAQQEVIRGALIAGKVMPEGIEILEMHGTGTALGDPIEIGAATSVFAKDMTLEVQAAKATVLHAEPAAGAVGLFHAMERLQFNIGLDFKNLVQINPYVIRVLEARPNQKAVFGFLRSPGCFSAVHNSVSAASISSFAFQGTNSHIIVERIHESLDGEQRKGIGPAWKMEPCWWMALHISIFARVSMQPTTGNGNLAFIGRIDSNSSWILSQSIHSTPTLPSVLLACLASKICTHALQIKTSLLDLVLGSVSGALNTEICAKFSCIHPSFLMETKSDSLVNAEVVAAGCIGKHLTQSSSRCECHDRWQGLMIPSKNFSRPDLLDLDPIGICIGSDMWKELFSEVSLQSRGLSASVDATRTLSSDMLNHSDAAAPMRRTTCSRTKKDLYLGFGTSIHSIQYLESGRIASHVKESDVYDQNFEHNDNVAFSDEEVQNIVEKTIHNVLEVDGNISDLYFADIGLDSITSIELKQALQDAFSLQLPDTIAFDYADVASLTGFIVQKLRQIGTFTNDKSLLIHPAASSSGFTILSVEGTSGGYSRSPGPLLEPGILAFLADDKEHTNRAPVDRFHISEEHVSKIANSESLLTHGCWIQHIDCFDSESLKISARDSLWLDPQSKLMLESTLLAIKRTISLNSSISSVGTYVGCVWNEFPGFLRNTVLAPDLAHLTGSGLNFASGIIPYTFNFKGPCIGIDTACSSSLVAVYLASNGLRRGTIGHGVSGGTNLMLLPTTTLNLAVLGSLSVSGRCKTLDSTADGYGRGEGCVAIVVGNAESHPSDIIGYIKGCECNQDGRSSSLTAPNGPSQASLIFKLLQESMVARDDILSINLHGTGTVLGDPIEIGALDTVYDSIASVKYLGMSYVLNICIHVSQLR